ncbi:hypothetical protein K1719_004212 [Acacia pycnantha]|nr:hypothetical protein K1719_004212 [Acacia pycnantha]
MRLSGLVIDMARNAEVVAQGTESESPIIPRGLSSSSPPHGFNFLAVFAMLAQFSTTNFVMMLKCSQKPKIHTHLRTYLQQRFSFPIDLYSIRQSPTNLRNQHWGFSFDQNWYKEAADFPVPLPENEILRFDAFRLLKGKKVISIRKKVTSNHFDSNHVACDGSGSCVKRSSEILDGKGTLIRKNGTSNHSDSNHEICDGRDSNLRRSSETLDGKGSGIRKKGTSSHLCDGSESSVKRSLEILDGKGTRIRKKRTSNHSDLNHKVCDGSESSVKRSSETLDGKGTRIRKKETNNHSDSNHEVCDRSDNSVKRSLETLDGKGTRIRKKGTSNHSDLNHEVCDGSESSVKRSSETLDGKGARIRKKEINNHSDSNHEVCDRSESSVKRSLETLDGKGTRIRKKRTSNHSDLNHKVYDGSESNVKRSSETLDGKGARIRKKETNYHSDSNHEVCDRSENSVKRSLETLDGKGTRIRKKGTSNHSDLNHEVYDGSESSVRRSSETLDGKGTRVRKKEINNHSDSNHEVCHRSDSGLKRSSKTLDGKGTHIIKKGTSNHSDLNHEVCDGSESSVDSEELDFKIRSERENPGISRSVNNDYSKTYTNCTKTILVPDETLSSSFSSEVSSNDFFEAREANLDESSASESASKGEQMDISHGSSKSIGGERDKPRISRSDNNGYFIIDSNGIKRILIPDEALSSSSSSESSSNDFLQARKAKFAKPSASESASKVKDSDVSNGNSKSIGGGRKKLETSRGDTNYYLKKDTNDTKSILVPDETLSPCSSSESSSNDFSQTRKANFAESSASRSVSTDEESDVSRQSSMKSEPGNDFPVCASTSPIYSMNHGHMGMSPTVVPPVQVMDRSPSPEYSSYRIPSSVFRVNTNPMDWTNGSDESLFSIQIGNPSLARDHFYTSIGSRVAKSGELNKFSPQPSPLIEGRETCRKSVETEDSQTTEMSDEDLKLEGRLDNNNLKHSNPNKNNLKHSHPTISYNTHGNGIRAQSSALPIKKKQEAPLCLCLICRRAFCCLSRPSCLCLKCCLVLCCCRHGSPVLPEAENQNSVRTNNPQVTSDSTSNCCNLCQCFSWLCFVSIVSLGLAVHGTLAAAVQSQIVLDTRLLIKPLKRHSTQLPNVSNIALGHAVHRKKISIQTHIFLDANHLIKIKLQAQHPVVAVGPYVRHLIKPLKKLQAQYPNVAVGLCARHLIKPLKKLQAQHPNVAVGLCARHLIKPLKKLQAQHPTVAVGPCVCHLIKPLKKLQAHNPIVAVGPYARGHANILVVVVVVERLAFKEFIHLFGFVTIFRYLGLIRFHFPYP